MMVPLGRYCHGHEELCCVGKYGKDSLPRGPRGALFRQILPGAQPLLDTLQQVAATRSKTIPQVRPCLQLLSMKGKH